VWLLPQHVTEDRIIFAQIREGVLIPTHPEIVRHMSRCPGYAALSPVVRIVKRLRRSLKQFPNMPSGPWLLALPDVLLKPFERFPSVVLEQVPDKTSARQAKEILFACATVELGNCAKVHFIRVTREPFLFGHRLPLRYPLRCYRRYRGAEYCENGLDEIGTQFVETVEKVDVNMPNHIKKALENEVFRRMNLAGRCSPSS
jgi:hypothetical protein